MTMTVKTMFTPSKHCLILWSWNQGTLIASVAWSWNLSLQANKKVESGSRTRQYCVATKQVDFWSVIKTVTLPHSTERQARQGFPSLHLVNDTHWASEGEAGRSQPWDTRRSFLLFTWSHYWAFEVKQKIWCKILRKAALQGLFILFCNWFYSYTKRLWGKRVCCFHLLHLV